MRFKLIACSIFTREVCRIVADSPNVIDLEFTDIAAHESSDNLREQLQNSIDKAQKANPQYDAILLCYGLCGNATMGLRSKNCKLVLPRAHDCCTILLGDKEKFKKHFSNCPSMPFCASGYMERTGQAYLEGTGIDAWSGGNYAHEDLAALYGEENAAFLAEALSPHLRQSENNKLIYISLPETKHLGYEHTCRKKAGEESREFIEISGDVRLIQQLVAGEWNNEEYLVVGPGMEIQGVYDWDEIIRATPFKTDHD